MHFLWTRSVRAVLVACYKPVLLYPSGGDGAPVCFRASCAAGAASTIKFTWLRVATCRSVTHVSRQLFTNTPVEPERKSTATVVIVLDPPMVTLITPLPTPHFLETCPSISAYLINLQDALSRSLVVAVGRVVKIMTTAVSNRAQFHSRVTALEK